MLETLINFGSAIKSLDNGRIGGYLVMFSNAKSPDLAGDFFTADTDFGFDRECKTAVWLNHRHPLKSANGQVVSVKTKIGEGTLTKDENGVLIDAILYEREQYEGVLSSLGWSSGTASHLVDREQVGKAWWIKSWPLGLDASATPTPCEPRTAVLPFKSWTESFNVDDTPRMKMFDVEEIKTERQFEQWLRDADCPNALAVAITNHGFKKALSRRDAEDDASSISPTQFALKAREWESRLLGVLQ